MNINKFTQKSAEALNNCEKLAYEYGNQEVDQEHLLYSLLTIEDSLIAKLVEKMEIHLPSFIERARKALEQKTKVYFAGAILFWIAGIDIIIRCVLKN